MTPKCDHPTDALVGFRRQTRRCTRDATYTDGAKFYCTQHAKEPATMTRKASGKIRADLRLITTDCPLCTCRSTYAGEEEKDFCERHRRLYLSATGRRRARSALRKARGEA